MLTHELPEPILDRSMDRFVLYPINFKTIWRAYKDATRAFWMADKIESQIDAQSWKARSSEGVRKTVSLCIMLLGEGHAIMHNPLLTTLSSKVTIPEARSFFGFQAMIENVHAESFSWFRSSLLEEPDIIIHTPILATKVEWAVKWVRKDTPFGDQLVAMAAIKHLFSASLLCLLTHVAERSRLPTLPYLGFLVRRDSKAHGDFACTLFHHLRNPPSQQRVTEIVLQAAAIEQDFAIALLDLVNPDNNLCKFTKAVMQQYIEFLADNILCALGCRKLYLSDNPMRFMDHPSPEATAMYFSEIKESATEDVASHMERKIHEDSQPLCLDDIDF